MNLDSNLDADKPTVWLHVHVPKAGGSTLRQIFNRNFEDGYYNSVSLLETKQYSREEVSEIVRCHPWVTCLSDHKLSMDLPYDHKHSEVFSISFVREPIERFISRYFFHRHFEEVNCIAQRMSFREFAETELEQGFADPQTNSQIYFLNGGKSDVDLSVIQSSLETDRAFLFPIERFDEACVCIQQLFPNSFKDLSYVSVNISKRDQNVSEEDREYVKTFLAKDQPVFELAGEFLDLTIEKAFDSRKVFDAKLAEFKELCSRRYDNFQPPTPKKGWLKK